MVIKFLRKTEIDNDIHNNEKRDNNISNSNVRNNNSRRIV